MDTVSLQHITLQSNQIHITRRSDFDEGRVAELLPLMREGEGTEFLLLPGQPKELRIIVSIVPGFMMATIAKEIDGHPVPMVTMGVAMDPCAGVIYWPYLFKGMRCAASPENPPVHPWMASYIEPHAVLDLHLLKWLGGYQQVVAWAYVEWLKRPR